MALSSHNCGRFGLATAAAVTILAAMSNHSPATTTTAEAVTTAPSAVAGMAPVAGNGNLLVSGVPPIDEALRQRVAQYLNARAAALLDVSDDGKQVLMATRFASTMQLHVLDQPMGARTQITFSEEPIGSARFMPGDPQTIFYMQDKGGGEFHQIYRLDRRTGRSTLLTDGKSKHGSLLFSHDGRRLAFTNTARNGKDTDVYVADVGTTLTPKRVTEREGSWSPEGFSPDGSKLLVVQFRSINDSDLHVLDIASGKMEQLTPKEGAGSIGGAAFSADGKAVYLVTNRYSDFNELYEIPLSGSSAQPRSLTRSIPWDVEGLEVARDGSRVVLGVNVDGLSKLYVLTPKTGKLAPIDLPPGVMGGMTIAAKRADLLTFSIDSSKSPSDIWQVNLRTKKPVRWTQSEVGGLDTSTFTDPELVRYPSTGGVKVPAFIYRPKDKTPGGRHPVVVIWHGGPESQSRPSFSPFIQMLANDFGIAVMLPNVRGSDGYGKAYLAMDDGVKREESLADIGATLDWIGKQPDLDPARIGIYGGSYGGYMTLATLAFYPERIKAGVAVVAVSSIPTFLKNTQDYRRDLRRAEYGDERIPEVRAVQERISPLNAVDRIKAALFVQQGKNDPRVPQSEAEQIVQAVRAKGQDTWYLLGLNEGHGFAKKENRDFALVATVEFLRQQLLPD
ncbi:MAG: alpha/beta fold hydrolase [Candidatus Sumerlaeaceae bacterium]|nr:alpha/beta fold hydrolase [Candidatus Sumerlaeaceae bacterium]